MSSVDSNSPSSSPPIGDASEYHFDPSISEEEKTFYLKAYADFESVRDRRAHCTVCRSHIGLTPASESDLKMHPILRVTHCSKCHDFYNSGEFCKGEDGSELYCRWCGQGGEVYCCSTCPFVFCKSCIIKNLSRGFVSDVEQNDHWNCFRCSPKILWPLRALHWALTNYVEKKKKSIEAMDLPENEKQQLMQKDFSTCCRLAKAKSSNLSDSVESLESTTSRRSQSSVTGGSSSSTTAKKTKATTWANCKTYSAKRQKTSNDEVVCTPDLLSMLEPDCQITVAAKTRSTPTPAATAAPIASSPKVISLQPGFGALSNTNRPISSGNGGAQNNGSVAPPPPPLVLRHSGAHVRPIAPAPVVRRTVVGTRTPTPAGSNTPVYHTINGFRIDLNSAAQQETFRLPNGKLIQVKRQGSMAANPHPRTMQLVNQPHFTIQSAQHLPQQHPQILRYQNTIVGSGGGGQVSMQVHSQAVANAAQQGQPAVGQGNQGGRPAMVRHVFGDTAIGHARTQLQEQIFSAMDICQHLTGKLHTLTNSNAYKQARNYLEVKELYIHLSYLLTYAIGRYKGLQDKCLSDMRQLGFVNDADSLENGQLAAGIDYVRYGQLDDVDLFNSGSNSFHNQIYEYRKSLHANLKRNGGMDDDPLSLLPSRLRHRHRGKRRRVDAEDDGDEDGDDDEGDDDDDEDNDPPVDDTAGETMDSSAALPQDDDSTWGENFVQTDRGEDDADETEDVSMARVPSDDEEDDGEEAEEEEESLLHQPSTEDAMRREELSYGTDRKLVRLIEQFPAIWCTRHPDYGVFETTRKHWRTIASHLPRGDNIKLRWKNIRKRYVRIERRIREGKRFHGYLDKATNFLANRDLPLNKWRDVDCGRDDGDIVDRQQLAATEQSLSDREESGDGRKRRQLLGPGIDGGDSDGPIEIHPLDLRIINYVKSHPVLWRKSLDPETHKNDEKTRRALWMHLKKSIPNMNCEELMERWKNFYDMYRTFRLKIIKNAERLNRLELKYSKYLTHLRFLYKIEPDELANDDVEEFEDMQNENDDPNGDECDGNGENDEGNRKLLDMPDDEEFVLHLVRVIEQYPALWNKKHVDYYDVLLRRRMWSVLAEKLSEFKRDEREIQKRWLLATFCYNGLKRKHRNLQSDEAFTSFCKNLPLQEMSFLQ